MSAEGREAMEPPPLPTPSLPSSDGANRFRKGIEWIALIDIVFHSIYLVISIIAAIVLTVLFMFTDFLEDKQVKSVLEELNLPINLLTVLFVVSTAFSVAITVIILYVAYGLLAAAEPTTPTKDALAKAERWFWANLVFLTLNLISASMEPKKILAAKGRELLMNTTATQSSTYGLLIFRAVGLTLVYIYKADLQGMVDGGAGESEQSPPPPEEPENRGIPAPLQRIMSFTANGTAGHGEMARMSQSQPLQAGRRSRHEFYDINLNRQE